MATDVARGELKAKSLQAETTGGRRLRLRVGVWEPVVVSRTVPSLLQGPCLGKIHSFLALGEGILKLAQLLQSCPIAIDRGVDVFDRCQDGLAIIHQQFLGRRLTEVEQCTRLPDGSTRGQDS